MDDLIRLAGEHRPLACDGCGRTWDRADMLEAWFPGRTVKGDEHFPVSFTLLTMGWVGPCCAELANQDQP